MAIATNAFSGMSVSDIETAKEFYTRILDMNVKDEGMGLLLELPGGSELFLYQKEDHQPAEYTSLNLVVDDIDAAVDELTRRGIVFARYDNLPAPQDDKGVLRGRAAGYGPDIAWFKDPAGNTLSILQN